MVYLILRYCFNSSLQDIRIILETLSELLQMKQHYPVFSIIIFSYYLLQVRSIFLRGFDQQLAEMIGTHMTEHGMKFIRPCVPTKIEKVSDGNPGLYKVLSSLFSYKVN
jgi:hypothetical protein